MMSIKLYEKYIGILEKIKPYSSLLNTENRNINKEYAKIFKEGKEDSCLNNLTLESDILNINKSIESGLTPASSGISKDADGQDVEFMWPDYRKYGENEFAYFLKRYEDSENIQLKVEYGLLLFISGHLQHSDDRISLYSNLWDAIQNVYLENWNKSNRHFLSSLIKNALFLSVKSKYNDGIKQIISFIQAEFFNKNPDELGYYTFYYVLIEQSIQYKKEISSYVDSSLTVKKAIEDAQELEVNKDYSSAKSIITKLLKFKSLFHVKTKISLEEYLGVIYEKLGDKESERESINSGPHFFNESITYFKLAKSDTDVERVQKKYSVSSGKMKLGLVSSGMPEDETKVLNEWIDKVVDEAKAPEIMQLWGLYAQIQKKSTIEEILNNRPLGIQSFMSHSLMDKFGNTVEEFVTELEIKDNQFWFDYGLQYQMGIQIFIPMLTRVFHNKRFSSEDVIKHFENSWFNDSIQRYYNGELKEITPFDTIKPSLQEFLQQFNKWLDKDESKNANFVCAIDSLSLKIEPLLRFMCEKLGVNTTIQTQSRNKYAVVRHKTLGPLIQSLKDVKAMSEEDFVFLDYTVKLSERVNLRNDPSHGLLDINEYNPARAIQIISVLIRLSNYDFTEKKHKS